jgi:hypothetical protein
VIDGTELVVMSGNLTSQYYSADRNYSVTDTDTADAAAFETVFNADYTGATVTPTTPTTWSGARPTPSPGSSR